MEIKGGLENLESIHGVWLAPVIENTGLGLSQRVILGIVQLVYSLITIIKVINVMKLVYKTCYFAPFF